MARREEEVRLAEERRLEAIERKRRVEEETVSQGGVVFKGRGRMKAPQEERGMRGW